MVMTAEGLLTIIALDLALWDLIILGARMIWGG